MLKLLQLSVWPALRPLFGRLAYPAAYTVSLLLLLLGSFYLGLAHLPTWLAIVPFLLLLGVGIARRRYGRAEWEGVAKWDAVFLVFFLFVLELQVLQPVRLALLRAVHGPRLGRLDHAEPGRDTASTPGSRAARSTSTTTWATGSWPSSGLIAGVPARVVFNLVLPTVFGALGRQLLPDRPRPARSVPLAPARVCSCSSTRRPSSSSPRAPRSSLPSTTPAMR